MTSGTTTWTNTYNSDGLRTSRTNGTTTYNYYYEGSQLTSVSDGDVDIWIFYDGSRPVIIKCRDDGDEDTYHYELNLQGDVIAILDSDGIRVVEYTYDAWGKILSISGSMKDTLGVANPLRYRGYVYDNETGMYYCQSRYYDPEIGRWLNADGFISTGQGFVGNNMFAYCGNEPVARTDTSGQYYLTFGAESYGFTNSSLRHYIGGGASGATVGGRGGAKYHETLVEETKDYGALYTFIKGVYDVISGSSASLIPALTLITNVKAAVKVANGLKGIVSAILE